MRFWPLNFHCVGFGSINIDEFWEAPSEFFQLIGISPGEEIVREVEWFNRYYPILERLGTLKAVGPGGSAANTIAALNRMGFTTGFFGAVGADFHDKIDLEELGLKDHLHIKHSDCPSGRCLALIDPIDSSRDRALVITPNANDSVTASLLDRNYFIDTDWVHLTSFVSSGPLDAQRILSENLSERNQLSFDPGVIYCRLGIEPLKLILARSQVLFVTYEELFMLTGLNRVEESMSRLLSIGVQTIVLKMGPKGIRAVQSNDDWFQEAVPPIRVIDRTGAGDVVAAGFLAGMILSLPISECLELAAQSASKSLESYGREAYPDRKYLGNFLANRNRSFCS
jgi:ribokinase